MLQGKKAFMGHSSIRRRAFWAAGIKYVRNVKSSQLAIGLESWTGAGSNGEGQGQELERQYRVGWCSLASYGVLEIFSRCKSVSSYSD